MEQDNLLSSITHPTQDTKPKTLLIIQVPLSFLS